MGGGGQFACSDGCWSFSNHTGIGSSEAILSSRRLILEKEIPVI
jgi:hypothetical protein